jgi:hypothetical protein
MFDRQQAFANQELFDTMEKTDQDLNANQEHVETL